MITSTRNPKIQELRALQKRAKERREAAAFVIEGVRLAEEALSANWPVTGGIRTEDLSERGQEVVAQLSAHGVLVEQVSSQVMTAASETKSPQGLLLKLAAQELPIPENVNFVLIADEVRDPGNLGALLRSAAAAGIDAVLLTPGCADAFAPKVLRSGMGAHFQVAMRKLDWTGISTFCQQHELQVFLSAADEGASYDKAELTRPLALILGGEARGAGEEARALAKGTVHIPMPGKMESLNVAIAGSLLLFEALRQRRAKDS